MSAHASRDDGGALHGAVQEVMDKTNMLANTAEVVAARPLSEAQLARLSEQLRRSVGRRVSVDTKVDPGLIGGMIVKVGSRMVDGSVKSKLQRLQLAMKGIG